MDSKHDEPLSPADSLREFPGRALVITLFLFLAFVPLAYSPEGSENGGEFNDFYYWPKLAVGLFFIALAAFFWLVRVIQKRAAFRYSPLFAYAGIFLVALAIAVVLSSQPSTAFWGRKYRSEGLLAFIMYAAAFFLFANAADSPGKLKIYIYALLAGAGLAAAYGIMQFFGLEFLPRDFIRVEWWRAFATSGNPNFLSAYLLLALPFPALFFLERNNAPHRAAPWLLLSALVFSCILATYHRGAWVGMGAGVVVSIFLFRRKSGSEPFVSLKRVLILAAVFAACAFIVNSSATAMERPSLASRASAGTSAKSMGESTIQVRNYINRATLSLVAKRPAFGWGPDTMIFNFPLEAPEPAELGYTGMIGARPDKPENLLLQIAYEGGMAALTPFIITVGLFLIMLWRAVSKLAGAERTLAAAILVGCVCYLAQQQFSFSTLSTSPVFWSLMGLGIAAAHRVREKN